MTLQFYRIRLSIFLLMAFTVTSSVTVSSWAQSSVISASRPVTLYLVAGQPAILKIDENHEATVYVSHTDPMDLNINFAVAENLCVENYREPQCTYSTDVAFDRLVMNWSKHSDPSKIGQNLTFQIISTGSTGNFFRTIEESIAFTSLDPYITKMPDSRFTGEKFICDQYEWLGEQFANPLAANKALPDLRFKILTSESMQPNAESGLNENRTTMMAENVLFRSQNESFKLMSLGRIIFAGSYKQATNLFFLGQTSTLQVMGSNPKQQCQISLSYNILQSLKGRDTEKNYNEKPNFQVFLDFNNPKFSKIKSKLLPILNPPANSIVEFQ